ncbi:MAG: hypothetical protein JWQ98_1637 [Chlorobi bacterium]|nr:hypothetical protein [Chlorobiota bacterium]
MGSYAIPDDHLISSNQRTIPLIGNNNHYLIIPGDTTDYDLNIIRRPLRIFHRRTGLSKSAIPQNIAINFRTSN